MTLAEAREVLKWANSYSRMEMVIDQHLKMHRQEWLQLLGEEWSCCDNIAQYRLFLSLFRRICG